MYILMYTFEVLVLNSSFSIYSYFILLVCQMSKGNIVLSTSQHIFLSYLLSYYLLQSNSLHSANTAKSKQVDTYAIEKKLKKVN